LDAYGKLDEIIAMIESARSMPMSASAMVNRGEVLAMLDDLRAALPDDLDSAARVLQRRDEVIDEGRAEASRIIDNAHEERLRLVEETDVYRQALIEGERLVAEADSEATRMRSEVDDYVDHKLANFEIVLERTLAAVHRGRDKLRGRSEFEGLEAPIEEPPLLGGDDDE
jgi:cell division septum initiation protein DivIVA